MDFVYPDESLRQVGDEEIQRLVLEQEDPKKAWDDIMVLRRNMKNYDPMEEDDEKMAEEDPVEKVQPGMGKELKGPIEPSIIQKSVKIPSLENDLINDVLGKEECLHDLDIDVMDCDPDSEDDDWDIGDEDDEHSSSDSDEDSIIDNDNIQRIDDVGVGVQSDKNRNLSHLKPWEKTLPEFVVGQMAHNPCGPNVAGGTKRRCWIGGKCVSKLYNYSSEFCFDVLF